MKHLFTLLVTLTSILAVPASAIEPDRHEAVVYRLHNFDGTAHQRSVSFPAPGEIVVAAGRDIVIEPRQTMIYYWPLSRAVYTSWSVLDELVEGELEILRDGAVIETVRRSDTAIVFPNGPNGGGTYIETGIDADTALARHQEAMTAYHRLSERSVLLRGEYERALLQAGQARREGRPVADPPPPPPQPEPPAEFVRAVPDAFTLSLAPGSYDIRIRRDGRIVESSQRTVRVIEPRATGTVAWQVVPEERWTRPIQVTEPGMAIYAAPGANLYLSPLFADAYDRADRDRLRDPQALSAPGTDSWVMGEPVEDSILEVRRADGSTGQSGWRAFTVVQTRGEERGYSVVPVIEEGGGRHDLNALTARIPQDAQGTSLRIMLRDPESGELIPDSTRRVHVVAAHNLVYAWALIPLPLLLWAANGFLQRRVRPEYGRRTGFYASRNDPD